VSVDWAGVAAEVAQALGEVSENKAALIVTTVTGGGTPSNPGTETTTEYQIAAYESAFTWQERQGSAIQSGDMKLITAAPAVQPDTSMKVRWAGNTYQIIKAEPTRPDGATALVYMLHLRR